MTMYKIEFPPVFVEANDEYAALDVAWQMACNSSTLDYVITVVDKGELDV